jgi:hypothetical protein
VRNTFLELPVGRSNSLDGFLYERQVRSAPGSKVEGIDDADMTYTCTGEDAEANLATTAFSVGLAALSSCGSAATPSYNAIADMTAPQAVSALEPPRPVLQLADMLQAPGRLTASPVLGSPELPTVGSAEHASGQCKPCAFVFKPAGCGNGVDCAFCHLCHPSEKKRRQKEKKALLKSQNNTSARGSFRQAMSDGLSSMFRY